MREQRGRERKQRERIKREMTLFEERNRGKTERRNKHWIQQKTNDGLWQTEN